VIEKYFRNLNRIDGIEAFVLMDDSNRIIGRWINSKYDTSIFTEIGKSYLQIFGIEESLNFDIDEIVILFERGLIFVRNHLKFFLIIIANPHTDISYIRLAVNVSIFELEESRKGQKLFKKLPLEKPRSFRKSELDDVERLMIKKITENRNGTGTSE
jgi:hypothetical protein